MRRGGRRWLLRLHLYVGLACAPYLMVYGLSALSFNHDGVAWLSPVENVEEWSARIDWAAVRAAAGGGSHRTVDRVLAEAARDALGLAGHTRPLARPPRGVPRGDTGAAGLRFRVNRPGARHEVAIDAGGEARVVTTKRGLWSVLRGVHGLVALPGTAWAWSWAAYTLFSIAALIFSVASGLWLWGSRARPRAHESWLLAAGTAGGLLLMGVAMW